MTPLLLDTGPLVALLNADDPHHARCAETLAQLPAGTLITTPYCLTEAAHLLRRSAGFAGVAELLFWLRDEVLHVHFGSSQEVSRICWFIEQYRDLPCDIADASLLAAAENLKVSRIFTIDRHFYAYRFHDGSVLQVVPTAI